MMVSELFFHDTETDEKFLIAQFGDAVFLPYLGKMLHVPAGIPFIMLGLQKLVAGLKELVT